MSIRRSGSLGRRLGSLAHRRDVSALRGRVGVLGIAERVNVRGERGGLAVGRESRTPGDVFVLRGLGSRGL